MVDHLLRVLMPGHKHRGPNMKAFFDKLFSAHERISYRRLMVFCSACALLFADKLTGDQWVLVAVSFIAGEAAPKMAAAFKGN